MFLQKLIDLKESTKSRVGWPVGMLKSDSGSRLKDFQDSLSGFGRALEIQNRFHSFGHRFAFFTFDDTLSIAFEPFFGLSVVSQVFFIANDHYGHVGTKVLDFGSPFLVDVLKRRLRVDGETHEYHIGVWIGERTQSVVIFLACCVPKTQLNLKLKIIYLKKNLSKFFTIFPSTSMSL